MALSAAAHLRDFCQGSLQNASCLDSSSRHFTHVVESTGVCIFSTKRPAIELAGDCIMSVTFQTVCVCVCVYVCVCLRVCIYMYVTMCLCVCM